MLAIVWMVNSYMQSLVDLHIILHNPFLNDLLGISHERIAGGISALRKELMEQKFCFPDLQVGTCTAIGTVSVKAEWSQCPVQLGLPGQLDP